MKHLLCVVTFAVLSSTLANAQTIADIARQERAKKPAASQPAVVVTNKSLGVKPRPTDEKPAEDSKAATTTAAPAQGTAAPAPAAAAADARDEKWWRAQFGDARTEVRRAENQVAVAQLELNSANRDFLTRSYDPDGRGPAAIAAATKRLDDTNQALAAARAKVTQLEDELRRAGAPAGWGR